MTYLYILESIPTGRWYIGITNDLQERLKAHNGGFNKSTRQYRPYRLLFSMAFETKAAAMDREKKLKNLKSRKKVAAWVNKVCPGSIPEN
jgi:putative endonuclease